MKQKVSGEAAHGSGATLVGAVGSFFDKERRKNNLVVHNILRERFAGSKGEGKQRSRCIQRSHQG